MKVVLRSDVDGVGKRGDIVDVAGGFARNYLFPGQQAIPASEGVTAEAAAMRRARDQREARDREAAESQAGALAGATVRIAARAASGGKLFGSVSATEIAAAVQEQKGVEVDRQQVSLEEPIKQVGAHEVTLDLFDDVTAVVTVEVVAA